jgi:hypothetical protein
MSSVNKGLRGRQLAIATFFLFIAILMPSQVNVHLWGDSGKFTPGRIAILILLVPAISQFMRPGRHVISADFFAIMTAAWMILSRLPTDGLNSSAVAELIEFFGAYLLARGLYWGPLRLHAFYQVLKVIVPGLVILSTLDPLFHTNIIWHGQTPQERLGLIRAASVFDGAEVNGAFFAAVAPIFLYSEASRMGRLRWTSLCFFGCLLTLSSGPLLSFLVVLAVYLFDNLMGRSPWRWKALITLIAALIAAIFAFTGKPVSWIVQHLTFDPQSSYFRLYMFDFAFGQIGSSPIFGVGFDYAGFEGDDFLTKASVDNTWIVYAVRFGIPMISLLFITMITSFARFKAPQRFLRIAGNRVGTGYTLAIVSIALTGLTVHIFHTDWVFWGLLTGIRGTIKEFETWSTGHFGRSTTHRSRQMDRNGPLAAGVQPL